MHSKLYNLDVTEKKDIPYCKLHLRRHL